MDAIAAGPPLHTAPPHDEGSEKVIASSDFDGHGIAAVEFRQLDRVRQVRDYLSASYATLSRHAVNPITEGM